MSMFTGEIGVGVIVGCKDYRRMVQLEDAPPVALWPLDAIVSSEFQNTLPTNYGISASSADWTITQNGGPNGDNCATPDGATVAQSVGGTSDFDPTYGSGSEAFTVGVAIRTSGVTVGSTLFGVYEGGSDNVALWRVALLSDETVNFEIQNTTGGAYLTLSTSSIGTADEWHHVVFVVQTGSARSVTAYVNNASDGTTSSTSGSPRTSVTGPDFYLATDGAGTNDVPNAVDMMMVSFYDYDLSTDDIERHYLHLFAA